MMTKLKYLPFVLSSSKHDLHKARSAMLFQWPFDELRANGPFFQARSRMTFLLSLCALLAALAACSDKTAVKPAEDKAAIEQVHVKAPPPAPAPTTMPAQPTKPSTAQPNVHVLEALAMPGLDRTRTIRLYLPPGYETSRERYPVLYMHDGQNLFDAATSYAGEWGVDETLNELARTEGLKLIVVGIDNGEKLRVNELNPWDNARFGKGEGAQYMHFIVDVVKPYIDTHYRTKPDRANTAIMGSSMGGLISHYAIATYPKVFSKAGIFSPAYWLAPAIFDDPAERKFPRDAKLYFYAGGKEGEKTMPGMSEMERDMNRMVATLRAAGIPARNLAVEVNPEAQHNEAAWRAEFPKAVNWLFAR
jgi:predicted alpha/beta superfamily hydrolase